MPATLFDKPKHELDFESFHSMNPKVYELFKRFTFEAIAKKHRHYSADAIMHRVRWETSVQTAGGDFKINNNHVAFYARLFMSDFPEYQGFFETRKSRVG